MRRQKSIYGEMKDEMIRRKEMDTQAAKERREQRRSAQRRSASRERSLSQRPDSRNSRNLSTGDLSSVGSERSAAGRKTGNFAVASVNHLEVPAELAFIFSKLERWKPAIHMDKSMSKVSGQVPGIEHNLKLPSDIDYYVFSKVANIYFKSHLWQMKREPIQTPFLSKSKDSDFQESLAIFKLILRFMNDTGLTGRREKVLADYIVNKGLTNAKLRDEIYCQLANQTWKVTTTT